MDLINRALHLIRHGYDDGGTVDPNDLYAAMEQQTGRDMSQPDTAPAQARAPQSAYDRALEFASRAASNVGHNIADEWRSGTGMINESGRSLTGQEGRLPVNALWQYPMGVASALASPITGAAKSLGEAGTEATGNPEFGERLGFTAGMMDPTHLGAAGKLAIFAGPMAKTADLTALNLAKKMATEGAERGEVWNKTGWFQGPDQKWRFEIPDNKARLDTAGKAALGGGSPDNWLPLSQYLTHKRFEAAYPGTDYYTAVRLSDGPPKGSFTPRFETGYLNAQGATPEEAKSAVLHELQHGVQRQEGFSFGANPNLFKGNEAAIYAHVAGSAQKVQNRVNLLGEDLSTAVSVVAKNDGLDAEQLAHWARKTPEELSRAFAMTPYEQYRRSAGEVEARNVQARMNMTPEERQATPPWMTQDVPEDQQIVRMGPVDTALSLARRTLSQQGLYSHAAETAASLPQAKGTPEQFKAMLLKAGVKPDELANAGYDTVFGGRPSVTRDEVAAHFGQAMPKIEETVLGSAANKYPYTEPSEWQRAINRAERAGNYDESERLTLAWEEQQGLGDAAAPKFQKYSLPGGENYREVLLRAPDNIGTYQSSHWDDPNVLAHLRMADRTGPNGEKVLHLEELQSDWGQAYRKYQDPNTDDLETALRQVDKKPIPSAPYVTSTQGWTDLALKRALKEAAEGGYDRMVWTPGAEQAKRYDLSKHIDEIHYAPGSNGTASIEAYKNGENVLNRSNATPGDIEQLVGRDIAQKIASGEKTDVNPHTGYNVLSGLDLQTGGEGMKGYYDKIVPKRALEVLKKIDKTAKVEPYEIPNTGDKVIGHSIAITPELRERIKQGFPAFNRGGAVDAALSLTKFGSDAARKAVQIAKRSGDAR